MNKYKEYIKSEKWKLKRQKVIDKVGYECEQCGKEHGLQVHHKTYDNLFNELLEDLQLLCNMCHLSKHDNHFNKVFKKNKHRIKPRNKKKRNRIKKYNLSEIDKRRQDLIKRGYKLN